MATPLTHRNWNILVLVVWIDAGHKTLKLSGLLHEFHHDMYVITGD